MLVVFIRMLFISFSLQVFLTLTLVSGWLMHDLVWSVLLTLPLTVWLGMLFLL